MKDNENSYLDRLVECPKCKQLVRDGDRIWLDGECLCPECYQHKRLKYYGDDGTIHIK